jgi:outer membrane protein assembly factor BamB
VADTPGESQDVELVDEIAGAENAAGPGETARRPGVILRGEPPEQDSDAGVGLLRAVRRARRGRNRWWWATGVVLVLTLVVPSAVHAQQERARLERLAEVPGILAPLPGPVAVLWRGSGPFIWNGPTVSRIGDMLVGTGITLQGSTATGTSVRGVDARTGVEVWSHRVDDTLAGGLPCVSTKGPTTGPGRAVTVCQMVDATAPDVSAGAASDTAPNEGVHAPTTTALRFGANGASEHATVVHLEVFDPLTGASLATYPGDVSDRLMAFQSDIVVSTVDVRQSATVVRRQDPRTGVTLWTAVHHAPDTGSGGVASAWIWETGDRIFAGSASQVWSLTGAGATVHEWALGEGVDPRSILPTRGGRLLSVTTDASDSMTVMDVDTRRPFVVPPGSRVRAGLDDGSAPEVLLTNAGRLIAWDLDTGQQLWTSDATVLAVLLVDGCVYSVGAGGVRAQDARTGAERWKTDPKLSGQSSLVTDGRVLVVAGRAADATGSVVRGLDLEDGRQVWETPLADETQSLSVVGGILISASAGGAIALG